MILKYEGFFGSQGFNNSVLESDSCYIENSVNENQDGAISKILVLTTSLLGVFLLVFGLLRDIVNYGVCRTAVYSFLIISYALMAASQAGKSDVLQDKNFNSLY